MNQLIFSAKKLKGTLSKVTLTGLHVPVSPTQSVESIYLYIFSLTILCSFMA